MNKLTLIPLLLYCQFSSATNYYIKNTGDDNQDGKSDATAWKTISKVNSSVKGLIAIAGDSILFRRGDTFYGSLHLAKSGKAGKPIVFGAYGIGKLPIISGFTSISGSAWSRYGNKAKAYVPAKPSLNMVTLNGTQFAVGRWPNKGYNSFSRHTANSEVLDNQLTNNPNWTGGEIVIRKNHWIIDNARIVSHVNSRIRYYDPDGVYAPINGYGYFIQRDSLTLDQFGEWYWNNDTIKIFFGEKDPSQFSTKVSTIDTLVYLRDCHYIIFEHLSFEGSNEYTFYLGNASSHIILQNCEINFSGRDVIWTSYGDFITINNCIINHTNNNVFRSETGEGLAKNVKVTNNTIKNTAVFPGLGRNNDGQYNAIGSCGINQIVENNIIDTTGYIPISCGKSNSRINDNYIHYYCFVKDDGSGIYVPKSPSDTARRIEKNIVINELGLDSRAGVKLNYPTDTVEVNGIYLDDGSSNILVKANTCAYNQGSGIFIHAGNSANADNNTVRDNTFYGNICSIRIQQSGPYDVTHINLLNNISFSIKNNLIAYGRTNYAALWITANQNKLLGTMNMVDSNYYAIVGNNQDKAAIALTYEAVADANKYPGVLRSLTNFQSYTSKEIHSHTLLLEDPEKSFLSFYYNIAAQSKIIKLRDSPTDIKGKNYSSEIILDPFSSIVLIDRGVKKRTQTIIKKVTSD